MKNKKIYTWEILAYIIMYMYIQSEHYVYKGYLNQTEEAAFYLYKKKVIKKLLF